ncbi:MAG: CYTH domain-containing protein [Tannerella sp.]|jgi:CYTH domain-containing protein|nr:CYTH domain-containing protein [Tannerella sp.]
MALEIERKFLVEGDFAPFVAGSEKIVQGYLCADVERTVRVRISGAGAFLTVKSAPNERGWSRYEFETPIPPADAEEMLTLCIPGTVSKVRHRINAGNHVWEVDVFHGDNEGLIVAEIELDSEDEPFDLPAWLGREVTGDAKYCNAMLAQKPFKQWNNSDKQCVFGGACPT